MKLTFAYQEWLYAETFRISRSAKDISPLFLCLKVARSDSTGPHE